MTPVKEEHFYYSGEVIQSWIGFVVVFLFFFFFTSKYLRDCLHKA